MPWRSQCAGQNHGNIFLQEKARNDDETCKKGGQNCERTTDTHN